MDNQLAMSGDVCHSLREIPKSSREWFYPGDVPGMAGHGNAECVVAGAM